jgi:hypothetical protein
MGRDIKITAKEIKKMPGPGEYNSNFDHRGTSKNHMLKHGWDASKMTSLKPEDLTMLNTTAQYLYHTANPTPLGDRSKINSRTGRNN